MNKLIVTLIVGILISGCTSSHEYKPKAGDVRRDEKPSGQPLSAQTYLRKLSLHIRGMTPSRTDYDDLAKAVAEQTTETFFRSKTDEYLVSDEHIDKMTSRLEELFFVRPSPIPSKSAPIHEASGPEFFATLDPDDYTIHNSMNQLFRDIASRNLSWDTLLLGRKYTAFPILNELNKDISDSMFLTAVAAIPAKIAAPTSVSFDEDDARVAGSLTTSRFFARYGNTALNKNRRRAAAVFRIFLCDDMKAVAVDEGGNQNGILDKVFPAPPVPGGGEKGGTGSSDKHGSDQACLKCHYKLDPMGMSFQSSGLSLSPFVSPGALVYTRADGGVVNIQGQGIGEIARTITRQKEYSQCQVRHFWDWYIGSDIPLDDGTLNELTEKFEQVDRKTNDFITYMVNRPEFGNFELRTPEQQMAAAVRTVLQNCNGCHANETKVKIPSFTSWPIGGDVSSHNKWLGMIRHDLALDGSPERKMPPVKSEWQPDAKQLDLLRRWFELGAPGLASEVNHATQ
ncbi:MAG: hypothetical protein ACXVA9_06995 [Bdellovibrionales bacterium]